MDLLKFLVNVSLNKWTDQFLTIPADFTQTFPNSFLYRPFVTGQCPVPSLDNKFFISLDVFHNNIELFSTLDRILCPSWREPWHKFEDWDWFNARNFCR